MTDPGKAGLYVHVPFCVRRCPYCDFYSEESLYDIPLYLKALRAEALREAGLWPMGFDTAYLGGGSPSILNVRDLVSLWETIGIFRVSPEAEITIEANPEDLTLAKVRFWRELGVTRVSLGAQSFSPRGLSGSLGRSHGVPEILTAIDLINKEGLSLSLDLIFGWSGQNLEDWLSDLRAAVDSGADHLSAYSLTAPPGTRLWESLGSGAAAPLPSEDMVSELFLAAGELLRSFGFRRYEVSNFARPGKECRHNLKYWKRAPYLGLGPAAHSFDGRSRRGNFSSLFGWAEAMEKGKPSFDFSEDIGPSEARLESFLLGLRLSEGIPLSEIRDLDKLAALIRDGFLYKEEGRILPSEKGFLTADYLARELA
jgi:oxygen-independent coproporphyrinogen-3 oxidase